MSASAANDAAGFVLTPAAQADEALLASLPGLAFAFVLVLSRTGTVVMLLPGLGESDPPPTVRAGLSLALSLLMLPVVAPLVPAAPEGLTAASMVMTELLIGGSLGTLARLPAMALSMCGAVCSTSMGLSSVIQFDPALGAQSSALARTLGLLAPLLVLATGLYELPLSALAGSYRVFPPGTVMPAGALAESVQQMVSAAFSIAIRLSAPFLLAGMLVQAALGLLARLVPQLQVYAVVVPGQILGGLALLGLLASPMLSAWTEAMTAAWSSLPGL